MTRTIFAVLAIAALLALLVLAGAYSVLVQRVEPAVVSTPTAIALSATEAPVEERQGYLHGRVTTVDGAPNEGRLRWGGDEEAFWGDYFDGSKGENPWAAHVPLERLQESRPLEVFGFEVWRRETEIELRRPFMARFGDIERVEASGLDLRVTLKSGTRFELDRLAADDFADGVRVWDDRHGVFDFVERQIRAVEFLATAPVGALPERLHGTVRTRHGDHFTGFLQWDGGQNVRTDALSGQTADGALPLRFDAIRSIVRRAPDGFTVTLLDGRQFDRSGDGSVSPGDHGIYVDDPRYGRVLVASDAFERVDLTPGGSGPAYGDFPPGQPLTGSVLTRDGRRVVGRLVYDLDESETTETLDAPSKGVDYTITFGLIASIMVPDAAERGPQPATVTLRGGEELRLERSGDLGDGNAGMLIFVDGREQPEYVIWADVAHVDLEAPRGIYPPIEE